MLVFPTKDLFTFNSDTRAISISILLLFFGIFQLTKKETTVAFYTVDFWWILLILYTGCSVFWSTSSLYAIYGIYTTTILYLVYKAFEKIDWEIQQFDLFYWTIFTCVILAIGVEFYGVRGIFIPEIGIETIDEKSISLFGKNFNLLGSLIAVLLPFVVFNDKRWTKFIAPVLLVFSLLIVYASGSAQATILIAILLFIYGFINVKVKRLHKYLFLLGLVIAVLFAGYTKYLPSESLSNSSVIKEFSQQNDRLLMWTNSGKLIAESPFIGHGKNNWELVYGKYGYQEYQHFRGIVSNHMRYLHAHNSIFTILSEAGIIGLIIYFFIGVLPWFRLFNKKQTPSSLEVGAIVSLFIFFVLSLVYGTVFNLFRHFQGLTVIAAISLAILSKKSNLGSRFLKIDARFLTAIIIGGSILCTLFFYNQIQAASNYEKGRLALRSKKYDVAESELLKSIKRSGNTQAYLMLSGNYTIQRKLDKSIGILKEGLEKDPYNINILLELAKVNHLHNDCENALKYTAQINKLLLNYFPSNVIQAKCDYIVKKDKASIDQLFMVREQLKRSVARNFNYGTKDGVFIYYLYEIRHKKSNKLLKEIEQFIAKEKIPI